MRKKEDDKRDALEGIAPGYQGLTITPKYNYEKGKGKGGSFGKGKGKGQHAKGKGIQFYGGQTFPY